MSLIKCPECGEQISDKAEKCIHCGCPVSNVKKVDSVTNEKKQVLIQKKKNSALGIVSFIMSLTCCFSFIGAILGIIDLCVYKDKKHDLAISAIIIGICLPIVVGIFTPAVDKYLDNEKTTTESTTESAVDTSAKEESKTESEDVFELGETYDNNGLQITISDLQDYNYEYADDEDTKYISVQCDVVNNGENAVYFNPYEFNCYADNKACDQSIIMSDSMSASTLSTGKTTEGRMIFEIPKESKSVILEYKPNIFLDKIITFVIQ